MINFQKLGIIIFSIGLLSDPSFALEDKVIEDISRDSYTFGFLMGQFTTTCGFYQSGLISEKSAKEVFDGSFQIMNMFGISKENKKNLLAFGERPENSKCKRFMPNN